MLVPHFRGKARRLEQALAAPHQSVDVGLQRRDGGHRHGEVLVQCRQVTADQQFVLDLVDAVVVLGMEQVVDGGEADVLVAAAVTDDVVLGKQFVVVGGRDAELVHCDRIAGDVIGVGGARNHRRPGVAVVVDHARGGGMCDIVQERMAGGEGAAGRDGLIEVALDQAVGRDDLRQAIGTRNKVAVEVGGQQGHARYVAVRKFDTEDVASLGLDVRPGRRAAVLAFQHPAGGHGFAVAHHEFAQEYLMRLMGGVQLVQVNPRRGLVDMVADVVCRAHDAVGARLVGGARQHHEIGRTARNIQRVVWHQRYINGAAATLADRIKAMVEELAEQGHEAVVRRREVRHHVRDEDRHFARGVAFKRDTEIAQVLQHGVQLGVERGDVRGGLLLGRQQVLVAVGEGASVGEGRALRHAGGRQGDNQHHRVGRRLVGNEVADDARLSVIDAASGLVVAGGLASTRVIVRAAQGGGQQSRHHLVGGAGRGIVQVVELAADGAQTPGDEVAKGVALSVGQLPGASMVFSDADHPRDVDEILKVQTKSGHLKTLPIGVGGLGHFETGIAGVAEPLPRGDGIGRNHYFDGGKRAIPVPD